ncbi:MAG: Nif3-like dinuclear metal center hexameric protein [Candidatus Woesearchaeota archaeon]|nr:Nif3-like dinuclear metal center hexameric protein [Candidatus Woesearchaeota archaeon]
MKIDEMAASLDSYFNVNDWKETVWNIIGDSAGNGFPADVDVSFRDGNVGRFLVNGTYADEILIAAFLTEEVIDAAAVHKDALLVCKHPMDWDEFDSGFKHLSEKGYQLLKERNISVYIAHKCMDNHPMHSPSRHYAKALGETSLVPLYHLGHNFGFGIDSDIEHANFDSLAGHVASSLGLNDVQRMKMKESTGRLVVVTGGGDHPEWLHESMRVMGEDITYSTGIARYRSTEYSKVHNAAFVALARELNINLIGAGHYPTEIGGVSSLAPSLSSMFNMPVTVIYEKNKLGNMIKNWGGEFYD